MENIKDMPPLVTVREAAKVLHLNIFTVYDLVRSRRIPHLRIGSKILFELPKLQRWIDARAVPERVKPAGGR